MNKMKQNQRTRALMLFLSMIMVIALLPVVSFATEIGELVTDWDNTNTYELSYEYIGELDVFGILNPTSCEIDLSGFWLDGEQLAPEQITALTASGAGLEGTLGAGNLTLFAKYNNAGAITMKVWVDVALGVNRRFDLEIGAVSNSVIGDISYDGAVIDMDPYGLIKDRLTLSPSDFTIVVNGAPEKLDKFIADYEEEYEYSRETISVTITNGGAVPHFKVPTEEDGEYTFIPKANDATTMSNTPLGVNAEVEVKLSFLTSNALEGPIPVKRSGALIVATIYCPTLRAEGTTKEIILQYGDSEYGIFESNLGPLQREDSKTWATDFPDFALEYSINGTDYVRVEQDALEALDIRFGQLRVLENGEIRFLRRTSPLGEANNLDDPSEECVNLWFDRDGIAGPPFQKIIALEYDEHDNYIELIIQNVVLRPLDGGTNLRMTGTSNENETMVDIAFVYKVTLIPTYIVQFNANGGSTVADMKNSGSTEISLPTPTRSGYTFLGWADVNGLVANPYIPTDDVTLTAQWSYNGSSPGTPTTPTNPTTPTEPEEADIWRPFDDVYVNDWYDGDTTYVWENDLMVGTAHRIFSPKMNMSRAMIVTALHRLSDEPAAGNASFPDVPVGMWYNAAIAWAQEDGVVLGYGDGRFGPNDDITRQDLAVILVRYAESIGFELTATRELPDFADKAKIADYAQAAVEMLYQAEILNGKDNNLFDPTGFATRAEVAAVLHRFVELVSAA